MTEYGKTLNLNWIIIAAMLSYKLYGFTLWMVVHIILGPLYVAYWAIFQSNLVR